MSFTQFAQEKDAASFRTAFQDAIQSAIADELEQQKFAIAQSMFGDQIEEEYDEDEMSDEEVDEFLDSLSDEELESLSEEVEQIDEISRNLLVRASLKAGEQANRHEKSMQSHFDDGSPTLGKKHDEAARAYRSQQNRFMRAIEKKDAKTPPPVSKAKLHKMRKTKMREEVEQMDEVVRIHPSDLPDSSSRDEVAKAAKRNRYLMRTSALDRDPVSGKRTDLDNPSRKGVKSGNITFNPYGDGTQQLVQTTNRGKLGKAILGDKQHGRPKGWKRNIKEAEQIDEGVADRMGEKIAAAPTDEHAKKIISKASLSNLHYLKHYNLGLDGAKPHKYIKHINAEIVKRYDNMDHG